MFKLFENWRFFVNESALGPQYTPEEFELENPSRPPGISKETWDISKERCLGGESEYCPHKREPWQRGSEEETERRPRREIEPTPIPEPPSPVQWYPKPGSRQRLEDYFWRKGRYKNVPARGAAWPESAADPGSDFVPIFEKGRDGEYNPAAWKGVPAASYPYYGGSEFDALDWGGEVASVGASILDYRHGIRTYGSGPRGFHKGQRGRQKAFESGQHPMSKEIAPWLYDKTQSPPYEVVGKHMTKYPHYAEYLLPWYLEIKKSQGGDPNEKFPGFSKKKWKKHLQKKASASPDPTASEPAINIQENKKSNSKINILIG